ncbi:tartrate dehydrogenase [Paraburkholderia hospita]|uniref:Tartrate dehydrogenase n=1 Tax=Paraburkholderia hospita TaxID=169430 RepID=A0ABN0FR50_9BURK|nr:tartrate dehydrogenase [Paraburkholderia hospita]
MIRARNEAHDAMLAAIEAVLNEGPHTGDLGRRANTTEVGNAVASRLA